jgi:hypothetical protein
LKVFLQQIIAKRKTGFQDVEEAMGIVMTKENTALILDEAYFQMIVHPPSQEKSGLIHHIENNVCKNVLKLTKLCRKFKFV